MNDKSICSWKTSLYPHLLMTPTEANRPFKLGLTSVAQRNHLSSFIPNRHHSAPWNWGMINVASACEWRPNDLSHRYCRHGDDLSVSRRIIAVPNRCAAVEHRASAWQKPTQEGGRAAAATPSVCAENSPQKSSGRANPAQSASIGASQLTHSSAVTLDAWEVWQLSWESRTGVCVNMCASEDAVAVPGGQSTATRRSM